MISGALKGGVDEIVFDCPPVILSVLFNFCIGFCSFIVFIIVVIVVMMIMLKLSMVISTYVRPGFLAYSTF